MDEKTEHVNKGSCGNENCNGSCIECCCFVCKVCGLYEGGLTTECPGSHEAVGKTFGEYMDRADEVYKGLIDFRNGQWVKEISIHSPRHHAAH